jgi:hypothetical protein
MIKTISTYTASSVLALLLFFGLALQTLAYDDLEIEIEFDDGMVEVDVDYDDTEGNEIELEFNYGDEDTTYGEDDLAAIYEMIANEADLADLELTPTDVEAVAVIDIDDDDQERDRDRDRERDRDRDRDRDDDGDQDQDRDRDRDRDRDYDDNRPAACETNTNSRAVGLREQCDEDYKTVAERVQERTEKREARCEEAELDDANDRERYFCRDGEWKEKREARLNDIIDGFIESDELDDESEEAIRTEIRDLIRQLIALILANR